MKEIAPNEIVISEESREAAGSEIQMAFTRRDNSRKGIPERNHEQALGHYVQQAINASTARLQEAHNEAHGKAAQEIARLREELITRGMEIAAERERVELLKQERNGKWVDKWGACKVCDGEIPHGHTDNCDVLKLEREIDALRFQNKELRSALIVIRDAACGESQCKQEARLILNMPNPCSGLAGLTRCVPS